MKEEKIALCQYFYGKINAMKFENTYRKSEASENEKRNRTRS